MVYAWPHWLSSHALDGLPVLPRGFGLAEGESEIMRGIAVELGEELLELFEVNAHLEDELA